MLGLPFHYRDERTDGMVERARARAGDDAYAITGIQTMPINTVFQLLADDGSAALSDAARIALVARPARLLAERRAGQRAHERVDDRPARRAHAASGRTS